MYAARRSSSSRVAAAAAVAVLAVSLSLPLLVTFGAAQEIGRRFGFTRARPRHREWRRFHSENVLAVAPRVLILVVELVLPARRDRR